MKMWKIVMFSTRNFNTAAHSCANAGRAMKKVMGHSSKKKKIYSDVGVLPSAEMFSKGSYEGRYSGSARRVSVLNKLFMKYITDLLVTGEYSSEFVGHGIEISRVQVSPDYNGVNVFWVAKGIQNDEVVEKALKKNAGFLRHELSSLRVIGNVPMIHFVKDKQCSQLMEVDCRLAKADFGEDHIPVELATKLKTQLELYTHLPSEIREKIENIDAELASEEEVVDDALPPMPQDVLGLNHSDILNRIKRSLRKSQASHRLNQDKIVLTQSVNENPINFTSNKERREAFKNFLEQRELLRSKVRKLDKNYYPDIEYMKEEFEERRAEYFKNLEIYEDRSDYLDDIDRVDDDAV